MYSKGVSSVSLKFVEAYNTILKQYDKVEIYMNLTIQLLRIISSPFRRIAEIPSSDLKLSELYQCSTKNRMPLLYLETLRENNELNVFTSVYEKENDAYLETLDAIARVSRVLAIESIKHVIFKTIRPYKSTTVDIDILILGNRREYKKSAKTMQKAGYRLVVYGPRSTTLWDQEAKIGIDLYEQVAVSFITYMDKEKLANYPKTTRLPNGEYVKTLQPEADLACIIAHSIIKEQMYTLSEYYTFIHYLKQMNINNFIQIVKQNNITSAVRTHATITALLHKTAHKTIPNELQKILNSLGEESLETTRLIKNNFETPHKYHTITIARSLLEITKGKTSRNSMATQFYHMLNPNFTKKFLKALMEHMKRETY